MHPGGEAAVVAVGVAVFEHPLEDGLREILGGGALAGEFHQKAEQRAVVAFEQLAERVELAVADGQHEGMVGTWFGGGGGIHGGQGAGAIIRSGARRNMNFVERGDHGGSGAWSGVAGGNRARAHWLPTFFRRGGGVGPGAGPAGGQSRPRTGPAGRAENFEFPLHSGAKVVMGRGHEPPCFPRSLLPLHRRGSHDPLARRRPSPQGRRPARHPRVQAPAPRSRRVFRPRRQHRLPRGQGRARRGRHAVSGHGQAVPRRPARPHRAPARRAGELAPPRRPHRRQRGLQARDEEDRRPRQRARAAESRGRARQERERGAGLRRHHLPLDLEAGPRRRDDQREVFRRGAHERRHRDVFRSTR